MDNIQLKREIQFRADRSSGSGGQHVNKVATKVTLAINLERSMAFSLEEKALLLTRLANKLSAEGNLIVSSQHYRSQALNRKHAWEKLENILRKALRPPAAKRKKIRISTNTPEKRRKREQHSLKKALRRKIRPQDIG